MPSAQPIRKVGVFVDVANLTMNGGYGMRFDVLREFACRDGADAVRLNAYASFDEERARTDPAYRDGQRSFFDSLRDFGYKVITKTVKWYTDDKGNRYGKSNADLDMGVDIILQSQSLDRIVIGSGDGDFARVVQAVQNHGRRVEVMAFNSVSRDLRTEADMFVSGFLVPNLLPAGPPANRAAWGVPGSYVRGVCYSHPGKGYGFLRVLKSVAPELWRTDTRSPDSPYLSVFLHDSQLPTGISPNGLPNRHMIFEFELAKSEGQQGGLEAHNVKLANPPGFPKPTPVPAAEG